MSILYFWRGCVTDQRNPKYQLRELVEAIVRILQRTHDRRRQAHVKTLGTVLEEQG